MIRILIILFLAFSSGGCISFYTYRPVKVEVRDGETGAAIRGAEVQASYLHMLLLNAPKPTQTTTDAQGIAELRAATYNPRWWQVQAEGYVPHTRQPMDFRAQITFELYRQPAPTITVVVPRNYRGPLMVERLATQEKEEPGKRQFVFYADRSGYVAINAGTMLMRADLFDIQAAFDDGTKIPRRDHRVNPTDVALHYVMAYGGRMLYSLGTDADKEALEEQVYDIKRQNGGRSMSMNLRKFEDLFAQRE